MVSGSPGPVGADLPGADPETPPRRRDPLRDFAAGTSGAVAVLVVILLPILLIAAGAAIDIAHINAERRYVQAQADLAALSAAHALTSVDTSRAAARATVAANPVYPTFALPDGDIEFGWVPARGAFTAAADQTSLAGVNAVRVVVTAPVELYLLDLILSEDDLIVRREAIAGISPPRVSFALSNCLATLRLLDPVLRPLLGVAVDVLCSGRGVDTRVDVLPMLTDISTRANLLTPSGKALTYGDILDADLPVSDLLTALTGVTVPPGAGTVRLGDALVLPADLRGVIVGNPVPTARLQISDLVLATAELLAQRVVNVETALDLGPFAGVRAAVRVGEPRQLVLGVRPGADEARAQTSQIRVEVDRLTILNLFTLRLNIRLANASARLTDQGDPCAMDPNAEIAVFDPVDASLLDIDLMTQAQGLPLGNEALGMQASTVRTRETRRIAFTRRQFTDDPVARLGPVGDPALRAAADSLQGAVSTLLDQTAQTIENAAAQQQCSGILGCALGTINALLTTLTSVATSLTVSAVNIVNGLGAEGNLTNAILSDVIGLDLARADLELIEVHCGGSMPRLLR